MNSRLREGEVQEYLAAFRQSSDRARYALYIVIIATLLIAIANYNVQPWAWPLNRLRSWYAVDASHSDPFFQDYAQLKDVREEYAKQFGSRAVFTSSPIPGVSIDVNDVGLIGGIALALLMLVQRLCVVREHENLFLALYKVRSLCSGETSGKRRGNSEANLLYHALAMSQVISSPPTLARWQRRGILSHLNLVFYLPVAVFAWVLAGNYATIDRAGRYGLDVRPLLVVQTATLILMLAFATSSWLHSRAMSLRWERAFFRVNPQLRLIDQPSQRAWLKVSKPMFQSLVNVGRIEVHTPGRLAAEIIDDVAIEPPQEGESPVIGEVPVEATIDGADVRVMLRKLFGSGLQAARIWCVAHSAELHQLRSFQATTNCLNDGVWRLTGKWRFSYRKLNEPK